MRFGVGFLVYLLGCVAVHADAMLVQVIEPAASDGTFSPGQEMVMYVTRDKLRLDSGESSSVIRKDKKATYSLLHVNKSFVVLSHPDRKQNAKTVPEPGAQVVRAKKTGKTEQINGFRCVEMEIEQSDGTLLDVWLSTDAAAVKTLEMINQWKADGYTEVFSGLGFEQESGQEGVEGLPIRTIVLDSKKKPTVRMEIKKISVDPLKDDVFEPPPGYHEVSGDTPADSQELSDMEQKMRELEAATENIKK